MMGISCGATLIKIFLILFNLIWLGLGAAIIYIGVNQKSIIKSLDEIEVDFMKNSISYAVIGFGVFLFLVSFMGCFGAFQSSSCLLNTYASILFILLVTECVGVYYSYSNWNDPNKIEGELSKGINKAFDGYKNSTELRKLIDTIQKQFECCGVHAPSDWKNELPDSCCGQDSKGKCSQDKAFKSGCVPTIKDKLLSFFGSLSSILFALIAFQLIIILSACCLAREVRHE